MSDEILHHTLFNIFRTKVEAKIKFLQMTGALPDDIGMAELTKFAIILVSEEITLTEKQHNELNNLRKF